MRKAEARSKRDRDHIVMAREFGFPIRKLMPCSRSAGAVRAVTRAKTAPIEGV